jgi:large subunit ribosomal protein L29
MRAEEIRELTDAEVRSRVAELEEERFRLRFRAATETLEDPLRLRSIRKDVARMKTVLREREREAAGAQGATAAAKSRGSRPRKNRVTRTAATRVTTRRAASARKMATRTTSAGKTSARKTKRSRAGGAGER